MDMSLDEYIALKRINTGAKRIEHHAGPSKFERIRNQETEEDDTMDTDDAAMPELVPFKVRIPAVKPKKPIHERLGQAKRRSGDSECESIHTSRLAVYKPQFKNYISNRLQPNFMSPAMIQRNKVAITALHSFTSEAIKHLKATDQQHGQLLLNSFSDTFEAAADEKKTEGNALSAKYNMDIQGEISQIQGKKLQWTCPDATVVSSDGPGIDKFIKVRPDTSNMSLNQRFA